MSGLAKLSGVDISTVSRALNDSPLVNGKTKELILRLANETGYAINARARNLRKQSSQTLGIVIPVYPGSHQNLSDPFFLEMIGAVSQAAAKHDYDLIINLPQRPSEISEGPPPFSGTGEGGGPPGSACGGCTTARRCSRRKSGATGGSSRGSAISGVTSKRRSPGQPPKILSWT